MKIQHTIILSVTAVALASCSTYSSPYFNSIRSSSASNESSIQNQAPVANTPTAQNTPTTQATPNNSLPLGHPDPQGRPNMVISPYKPYNVIDIKGYSSGEVVGDPSTAIVNPTTGKLDSSTSKHFRIP